MADAPFADIKFSIIGGKRHAIGYCFACVERKPLVVLEFTDNLSVTCPQCMNVMQVAADDAPPGY
jgi:hypothetical protein